MILHRLFSLKNRMCLCAAVWGFFLCMFALTAPARAEHIWGGRDLAAGAALYDAHCASCHGANLEGQENWRVPDENGVMPAPPHDASGHSWHHDTRLLFEYIALGGQEALRRRGVTDFKSGMPQFKDALTPEEILDVLAYIRSHWPEEIRMMQARRDPPHEQNLP